VGISASSIDLIVAVSGLKEVQDVIAAMRAADRESQRGRLGIEPTVEPRRVIRPEPRYESREVIHPAPTYAPRPVIHPKERVEARSDGCTCPPVIVVERSPSEQPMEAPWKTVPWKIPPQPVPKVKLAPTHPDINHKGMLLDFFI